MIALEFTSHDESDLGINNVLKYLDMHARWCRKANTAMPVTYLPKHTADELAALRQENISTASFLVRQHSVFKPPSKRCIVQDQDDPMFHRCNNAWEMSLESRS